ncbi:MAG: response regulator transcription factor [Bacteroidota bacterium]
MKKAKLLYVEDEIFLAKIVSESLQDRGYEVVLESDGAKAFNQFLQSKPDVCVLDIMLPNKDGFAIADEIRAKDQNVPIIFLSAKSQTADVLNGFSAGANDYMRKPFSIEELIVRIENVLKNKTETLDTGADIQLGNFKFNIKRQTLEHDNELRKLSYRESEMLRILFENKEKVIERSQILTLLWGSDSFFNSRNLDVYITKLRGYLKADPSVEIITVKGVGYRFVAG